ncbi:MAG: hypothetical protein Q6366_007030 [Candidatus Freyarchaeota archaeon]
MSFYQLTFSPILSLDVFYNEEIELCWLYSTLPDMLFPGRDSHSQEEALNSVLEGIMHLRRKRFERDD